MCIQTYRDDNPIAAMTLPPSWGRVAYRIPGKDVVWMAGAVILNPGAAESGFYVSPFDTATHPTHCILPDHISDSGDGFTFPLTGMPEMPAITKGDYEARVVSLLQAIEAGKTEKVVLSRYVCVDLPQIEALEAFRALCDRYPETFCYVLWTPQTGCWIGATPEKLVTRDGDAWTTVALAGTLPAQGNQSWTDKEYREQRMVSVYISYQLQLHGYDHSVGQRYEVVAGKVKHLVTPITIEGNGTAQDTLKLARLLHPTPAVCGLPVAEARSLIGNTEQYDRSWYTGFLGPLAIQENSCLYVNLRCGQLWSNGATLYVGGGIVAGSDPAKEWEETNQKATTLLSVLHNGQA